MSNYINRTIMSLHHMIHEMYKKKIELARIVKCAVQLKLSGVSVNSLPTILIEDLVKAQNHDGGFVANTDTIWNAKYLSFFPNGDEAYTRAIKWLCDQRTGLGFGRSARDMGRIPVTGVAFFLHPVLCDSNSLLWLEKLWLNEKNSLTYKAAYTLMAFKENNYIPQRNSLIEETVDWLASQQESDGGFAPWLKHPVGSNIYCTAVSALGLMAYPKKETLAVINNAYKYMATTQLSHGLWPYHELEDGAAWGLRAMSKIEESMSKDWS